MRRRTRSRYYTIDAQNEEEFIQEYENMKRQKILDQTKIWLADDGRWKAYVDVAGKRRLIAKRVRADLEDAIIDTYKDPKVKFKECFGAILMTSEYYRRRNSMLVNLIIGLVVGGLAGFCAGKIMNSQTAS